MLLVSQASSGTEAVPQFREHPPDVTLMDLRLPDLSGIDVFCETIAVTRSGCATASRKPTGVRDAEIFQFLSDSALSGVLWQLGNQPHALAKYMLTARCRSSLVTVTGRFS